jgi:hypothetical protein
LKLDDVSTGYVEVDAAPGAAPCPRPSIIFPKSRQKAGRAAPNATDAVIPIERRM